MGQPRSIVFDELSGSIRRTSVDNNVLERRAGLRENAVQSLFDRSNNIEADGDDGEGGKALNHRISEVLLLGFSQVPRSITPTR